MEYLEWCRGASNSHDFIAKKELVDDPVSTSILEQIKITTDRILGGFLAVNEILEPLEKFIELNEKFIKENPNLGLEKFEGLFLISVSEKLAETMRIMKLMFPSNPLIDLWLNAMGGYEKLFKHTGQRMVDGEFVNKKAILAVAIAISHVGTVSEKQQGEEVPKDQKTPSIYAKHGKKPTHFRKGHEVLHSIFEKSCHPRFYHNEPKQSVRFHGKNIKEDKINQETGEVERDENGNKIRKIVRPPLEPADWCAIFSNFALHKAGFQFQGVDRPKTNKTKTKEEWLTSSAKGEIQLGKWHTPDKNAAIFLSWKEHGSTNQFDKIKTGDVITLKRNSHMSLCICKEGERIITIDGNTADKNPTTGGKIQVKDRSAHFWGKGQDPKKPIGFGFFVSPPPESTSTKTTIKERSKSSLL